MKDFTLTKISDKLIKLAEEEPSLYPDFYKAELNLTNLKAELMMSQKIIGLASQPLRDAELNRLLVNTNEYKKYHELAPKYHTHEVVYKIYMQLARNLTAIQYSQ